jgi:MFS family permease
MSHGPAMASDLFSPSEIALPLTLAGVGRFGGPVIGPLIGGWINERAGWRWLAWTMTAFAGALTVLAALAVPETYAPAILRKRARALARSVGASHVTTYDAGRPIGDWKDECQLYLFRPFLFLTREPIVLLLSLHVSFLYGILSRYRLSDVGYAIPPR